MFSSSRSLQGSDADDRREERRAAALSRAQMMAENREGLGMKVIAVMVQRYGVLPREMWDLNSISDMGAARGITYGDELSETTFNSIITKDRYSITNLTIGRNVSRKVKLPGALRRLTIQAPGSGYLLDPLPETLEELSFGWDCYYNRPLVLPDGLRKLKLGRGYNMPITFPSTLVELELGSGFNQPITLPPKLLALQLGSEFSQSLILPQRLKTLVFVCNNRFDLPLALPATLEVLMFIFECRYNQPLVLPDNLRRLSLGYHYNQPLTLPRQLIELRLGSLYSHPLLLPDGFKRLDFDPSSRFNHPMALPSSLVSTKFGRAFNQPTALPNGIQELGVGEGFTHELSLPSTLRKLDWGCNRPIHIPEGVSEVVFREPFDQPVVLPASLKKITFSRGRYSHSLDFPTGLEALEWYAEDHADLVLPEQLQKLIWGSPRNVRLPPGLKELEITYSGHSLLVRPEPLVLPEGLLKVRIGRPYQHYHLPMSVREVICSDTARFTHPSTVEHLILTQGFRGDLSHTKVHKLTIDHRSVRMTSCWPQELQELAFTVNELDCFYPLRVPKGCRIVGEKRPMNVIME